MDTDPESNKKERSPSFPFIPLGKAIDRARAFEGNHGRRPVRMHVAANTWGYTPKSSGFLQTVAALKAFGLLVDEGSGEERKVQLTDLAARILHDARPGAKEQAIREAALKPRLLSEWFGRWGSDSLSDDHRISDLRFEGSFTESAARTFLKVLDDTISFANLSQDDRAREPRTQEDLGAQDAEWNPLSPGLPADSGVAQTGQQRGGYPMPLPPATHQHRRPIPALGGQQFDPGSAARGRATLPLPEGIAALELPEVLSEDSLQDVQDWLEVLMKRAARAAKRAGVEQRDEGESSN
jgi:hypothetical protein